MDGNGRWAKKRGLPRPEGHRQGAVTAEKISHLCVDFGIKSLTLYSFSIENWKRPREEVNALMGLYAEYLVKMRPKLMDDNVKLIHLGRMGPLPDMVKTELVRTIETTAANTGMVFALALNYGGRAEIIDATKEIARRHRAGELSLEDIDEQCISRHLYTANMSDPDLLIRTANELRVSNFLLWQISYSEFYVTETLWPDFGQSDLEEAILAYAKRTRRFGSVVDSKDG
jgi:undecaprenyl diphosphate synthase